MSVAPGIAPCGTMTAYDVAAGGPLGPPLQVFLVAALSLRLPLEVLLLAALPLPPLEAPPLSSST